MQILQLLHMEGERTEKEARETKKKREWHDCGEPFIYFFKFFFLATMLFVKFLKNQTRPKQTNQPNKNTHKIHHKNERE